MQAYTLLSTPLWFHYLLHNYVTNSNNVCKAAHDFLAKLMPINQRKILRHTVIGSLKFFLTMLHLEGVKPCSAL